MERSLINSVIFENHPVTIIGGGPSLKGFDFSVLQGKVLAINSAIFHCQADAMVTLDHRWMKQYHNQVPAGIPILSNRQIDNYPIAVIETDKETDKANMSGPTAMDITFKLGARRVYLLGFDGGYDKTSNFYHNENASENRVYEQANIYYNLFRGAPVKLFGPTKINTFPVFEQDEYQREYEHDKYTDIWRSIDYNSANNQGFAETLANKYNIAGRCLEIGAGSGTLIRELQQRGILTHGLDISLAGFRASTIGIEAPAWKTGLMDKSYDYTFSKDTLEHIPENRIAQTIAELDRITKKATIHSISTRESVRRYQNHEVHLTVKPLEWWTEQFRKANINFYLNNES